MRLKYLQKYKVFFREISNYRNNNSKFTHAQVLNANIYGLHK